MVVQQTGGVFLCVVAILLAHLCLIDPVSDTYNSKLELAYLSTHPLKSE